MKRCQNRGCFHPAPFGLGWGVHGMTQWFCASCFPLALVRLAGLLRCMGAVQ